MPALSAASSSIRGSSSSASPAKLWTRRQRSSLWACSGAWRRAATTASHAGRVAAILGRCEVSIGMPCSRAMCRNADACFSGVNPRSRYCSADSASTTIRTVHSTSSP